MRTSKNLSLISYNSEPFLHTVLERHVSEGTLESYWYIPHKADKGETKDHIHLYVFPARMIDFEVFKRSFNELDASNDKPLGVVCKNKNTGKLQTVESIPDAYWYSIHDSLYLEKRKEERNIKDYPTGNIVWSSDDFRTEVEALASEFYEELRDMFVGKTKDEQVYWALNNGYTQGECIARGYSASLVSSCARCLHYDIQQNNNKLYWESRQADSERTYAHVVEVAKQEVEFTQTEIDWKKLS